MILGLCPQLPSHVIDGITTKEAVNPKVVQLTHYQRSYMKAVSLQSNNNMALASNMRSIAIRCQQWPTWPQALTLHHPRTDESSLTSSVYQTKKTTTIQNGLDHWHLA